MKIGISQPTFLPWHGYFALIDYVDIFVFLDTVQFVKRSWIQRNKIKNGDKEQWITIPIKTKHRRYQTIKDTKIDFTHLNKKKLLILFSIIITKLVISKNIFTCLRK